MNYFRPSVLSHQCVNVPWCTDSRGLCTFLVQKQNNSYLVTHKWNNVVSHVSGIQNPTRKHWWLCCLIRASFVSNSFNLYILTWQKSVSLCRNIEDEKRTLLRVSNLEGRHKFHIINWIPPG
jgi:hypothetical protein